MSNLQKLVKQQHSGSIPDEDFFAKESDSDKQERLSGLAEDVDLLGYHIGKERPDLRHIFQRIAHAIYEHAVMPQSRRTLRLDKYADWQKVYLQ